ncbi:hypothetical protein HID58_062909 [Brassica napus]|uniref:Uncharacterized protein n=1 Tax=Brassica napus TaxID=3708 RepID=A0ABQ8A311_BRANA|nr:hypothetical protein HID58_062909 [Brassica napus]
MPHVATSLTLIDLASLFSASATRDACDTSPLTETTGVMSSSLFQLNSITRSDFSMRRLIPSGVDLYKYVSIHRSRTHPLLLSLEIFRFLLVFFSDLKSSKCSSVVEARLLRFWEARNVKRGGELMWVDMLLMDVNSTLMQATINANRLPKFRERLAAGMIYFVSGFDNFKLADSSLMIRFDDSTEFDVLSNPVSPIPAEVFRFRNQTELVCLANTNTQLPDIIGEIVAVKSTVSDPPEDKNRVMVTVKLKNDVSVTLSLFDAQAVSFHQKLGGMRGDPKVIVATSINPKMVGGRLFLNATLGTHVYYDKETRTGESFFFRDTGLPAAAPLLKSYAKVVSVTIVGLNNFITTAPPQEIDFLCTGRISELKRTRGGAMLRVLSAARSCSALSLLLNVRVAIILMRSGLCVGYLFITCITLISLRFKYRVEMVVADDTAEGTFVCFDGVMTKLHNLRASEAGFSQKNVIKTFGEMLHTRYVP